MLTEIHSSSSTKNLSQLWTNRVYILISWSETVEMSQIWIYIFRSNKHVILFYLHTANIGIQRHFIIYTIQNVIGNAQLSICSLIQWPFPMGNCINQLHSMFSFHLFWKRTFTTEILQARHLSCHQINSFKVLKGNHITSQPGKSPIGLILFSFTKRLLP